MSMATNASLAGRCRHNPARVSGSAVARSRRIKAISRSGITQRRTLRPARERRPDDGGTATSTGLVGSKSRPNSQAAVAPTKTVSGGSARVHAESVSQGSSGSSFQRYSSAPRRCRLLPLNALRVSPALRASSREKGLRVSSCGMHGVLPTSAQWGFRSISPTHVVKVVDSLRDHRFSRCPHSTQKLWRPRLWCPHDGQTRRRGGSACSHRSFSRRYQIPSSGPSIQRRPSLSSTARSRTASLNARGCKPPERRSSIRNL